MLTKVHLNIVTITKSYCCLSLGSCPNQHYSHPDWWREKYFYMSYLHFVFPEVTGGKN